MEQIPHKCPVCHGEGTRAIIGYEPECRACDGTGIVWGWKSSEPPVCIPTVWSGDSEPVKLTISTTAHPEPRCTTSIDLSGEQWTYTQ